MLLSDALAALFLPIFFIDFFLYLREIKIYDEGAIIFFFLWAYLFMAMFLISIVYFFWKLIKNRSAYSISSKVLLIYTTAWLSFFVGPPMGVSEGLSVLSFLWVLYLFSLIAVVGKRFLRCALNEGKVMVSIMHFLMYPKVKGDCKSYYTYRSGWIGFLISLVVGILLVLSALYGTYFSIISQGFHYGNRYPEQAHLLGLILLMAAIITVQLSLFIYLSVLSYAEDGIYGFFLLAGSFAFSGTFISRHISSPEFSPYLYIIIFIFAIFSIVIGVELIDEWIEERAKEKKIDRKQWLTFR